MSNGFTPAIHKTSEVMRVNSLKRYNPVVILVYFISVSGIAMFCNNPIVIALSFVGSLSLFFASGNIGRIMSHAPYFLMFVVFALINPLFYHQESMELVLVYSTS